MGAVGQVLCATDIAFDDWNVWFIESNVERRVKWRAALDRLKEFDARVVIPGHGSEKTMAILERAAADPCFEYTSCIDWTREYIDFYEGVYETAHVRDRTRGRASAPATRTSRATTSPSSGWPGCSSRRAARTGSTPLPGEPGSIFLNPFGHYDGDPPRE